MLALLVTTTTWARHQTPARARSLLPRLDALREQLLLSPVAAGSTCSIGAPSSADAARRRSAASSSSAAAASNGAGGGGGAAAATTLTPTPTSRRWTVSRAFTQADVDAFVALTGDSNPIHRAGGAAAAAAAAPGSTTPPPAPLVPGLLLASLFPAIIGSRFSGALYARQSLRFRAPARVGEPVVAEVSLAAPAAAAAAATEGRREHGGATAAVANAAPSSSRVAFDTVVRRADDGRVLVEGTALAIIPVEVQMLLVRGEEDGAAAPGG